MPLSDGYATSNDTESAPSLALLGKHADGTEGTSFTIVYPEPTRSSHLVYRIKQHKGGMLGLPIDYERAVYIRPSDPLDPNPYKKPNYPHTTSGVDPLGAIQNFLWLGITAWNNASTARAIAAPTNGLRPCNPATLTRTVWVSVAHSSS